MGSGLVGLHLKSTVAGELFTLSRSWVTLGEADSFRVSKAPDVKHKNAENKRHGQYNPLSPTTQSAKIRKILYANHRISTALSVEYTLSYRYHTLPFWHAIFHCLYT